MAGGHQHTVEHSVDHHVLKLQTSSYLLIPEWSTESIYGLAGAMLAAVAASVTYECLHEYLVHLRTTALRKPSGSECCGSPVVTCGEKLGQSIIQVMRVTFAYFLMMCIMTMNIWLLIAVVLGATVGYGVGKPLIANGIRDTVTSHGYNSANVNFTERGHRRSERSRSWRYQPVNGQHLRTLPTGADDVFSDGSGPGRSLTGANIVHQNKNNRDNEIIWLRRSHEELDSLQQDVPQNSDIQLVTNDTQNSASNFNSLKSEGAEPSRSLSRFKSTSKVINDSFRSYSSDSDYRRNASSASVFTHDSPETVPRRSRVATRTSSKVSRTSSASSGRFKPVSRQIRRQMSMNDDMD